MRFVSVKIETCESISRYVPICSDSFRDSSPLDVTIKKGRFRCFHNAAMKSGFAPGGNLTGVWRRWVILFARDMNPGVFSNMLERLPRMARTPLSNKEV